MIRLSRLTDYAIALLSHMGGAAPNSLWTASHLSEISGLPMPTVAKVLKLLAKDGIIKALRGAAGGYRLTRPIAQISIAAIIEAMDGPISITDCARGRDHSDCSVQNICPVSDGWNRVNTVVRKALADVSLAEMGTASVPLAHRETIKTQRQATGQ